MKGVGDAQAAALVEARNGRSFASLSDMAGRLDPHGVNKKALESLAAAGAFDALEPDRAVAFASIEPMLAIASGAASDKETGQSGLFGAAEAAPLRVRAAPWSDAEKLRREFEAVGFFLSGHPLEAYEVALKRLKAMRWVDFARAVRGGATVARLGASVLDRAERRTKSGSKMGIVQLSDPSSQYEAILFQEGLNQYRDLLEKGADVLVTLQANVEGEDIRARIIVVEPLGDAAAKIQKGLRIFVRDADPLPSIQSRLKAPGEGEVSLVVMLGPKEGEVESACLAAMSSTRRPPGRLNPRRGLSRSSTCERRSLAWRRSLDGHAGEGSPQSGGHNPSGS